MIEMNKIVCGDCFDLLKEIPSDSVHAVITDPPYGISILGNAWDSLGNEKEFQKWNERWAKECCRVLKPGGFLIAFGSPRCYHRLACGIEDAGFKIKDCLIWCYASGMPKSISLNKMIDKKIGEEDSDEGKKWKGWGTASLKPAFEPIVLAQKICEKSVIENVLKHEVGGMNIRACNIPYENGEVVTPFAFKKGNDKDIYKSGFKNIPYEERKVNPNGRFPSNVILTDLIFEQGVEGVVIARDAPAKGHSPNVKTTGYGKFGGGTSERTNEKDDYYLPTTSSYSKFFLIPKTCKSEKERGLKFDGETEKHRWNSGKWKECEKEIRNRHPSVKPVRLLEHLIKLVTREGQTVLDPFVGSGTTAVACKELNRNFYAFDKSEEYCKIAEARLNATQKPNAKLTDF